MYLANQLDLKESDLSVICEQLTELIEVTPSEMTTTKMENQGDIVLNLRDIKDTLQTTLKSFNKMILVAENQLCKTIAAEIEDGVTYKHPDATITATAKGWFNIEDPQKFFEWLRNNSRSPLADFVQLANSKKAREKLCTKLLEKGENVPDGIKEHIVASILIRRKHNGKKEK